MLGSEPDSRLGIKLKDVETAATQFMRAMEIMHFLHQVSLRSRHMMCCVGDHSVSDRVSFHQGRKNVVILIDAIDLLSQVGRIPIESISHVVESIKWQNLYTPSY